ncbi:MAG TPA: hypothetical protein ENK18_08510 [Deltaproteobacteria bacterium]|nr:hypothetical protein [Deltaproteobacteria bacterium]
MRNTLPLGPDAVLIGLPVLGLLGHRLDRRLVLGLLALSAGAGLSVAIAATVPGLLHPDDLHRLDGQLRSTPWPPPWSWLSLRDTHPAQQLELALPWLALAALPWATRTDRATTAMLALALLSALVPPVARRHARSRLPGEPTGAPGHRPDPGAGPRPGPRHPPDGGGLLGTGGAMDRGRSCRGAARGHHRAPPHDTPTRSPSPR